MTPAVPWRSSLRVRIAAALAVTAFALAAILGSLVAQTALSDAREQLREEAAAALRAGTATYLLTGEVAPTVQRGASGLPEALRAQLDSAGGDIVTFDDGSSTWAAWMPDDATTLAVSLPTEPVTERWQRLALLILIYSVATALLASTVGWFVAGGVTRRLRAAADHALALGVARADAVADPVGIEGRDEVALLAHTIDGATRDLLARIERERELTADAAHELRTPLTALMSAAELLDESPEAERVRALIVRLHRLTDDMLTLAREETSVPADTVVTRTSALAARIAESVPLDVGVEVLGDAEVRCADDLIVAAGVSLVANAAQHGASPIHVVADGAAIRVRDGGSGYPEEVLVNGPRRFHPIGETGRNGIGLVIAQRRIARGGGSLELGNLPRGGAEATIRLGPARTVRRSSP